MKRIMSTFGLRGVLGIVVMMLIASGMLRLGMVGYAVAKETTILESKPDDLSGDAPKYPENFAKMLDMIEKRTIDLDRKEMALLDREQALDIARKSLDRDLKSLIDAEERLKATINQVDGAAAQDVDRLTAVYQSMKPKMAAAVFEQMDPDFAAGFLAQMNSDAAANIMSELPSELAYAISVVLAGRNANAPTR